MPIKFTRHADNALRNLYEYGAQNFGLAQADAYKEELLKTLLLLERNPQLARLRSEYGIAVRIHSWRNYYIVYEAACDGILILHLLHNASDLAQHLWNFDKD